MTQEQKLYIEAYHAVPEHIHNGIDQAYNAIRVELTKSGAKHLSDNEPRLELIAAITKYLAQSGQEREN